MQWKSNHGRFFKAISAKGWITDSFGDDRGGNLTTWLIRAVKHLIINVCALYTWAYCSRCCVEATGHLFLILAASLRSGYEFKHIQKKLDLHWKEKPPKCLNPARIQERDQFNFTGAKFINGREESHRRKWSEITEVLNEEKRLITVVLTIMHFSKNKLFSLFPSRQL